MKSIDESEYLFVNYFVLGDPAAGLLQVTEAVHIGLGRIDAAQRLQVKKLLLIYFSRVLRPPKCTFERNTGSFTKSIIFCLSFMLP